MWRKLFGAVADGYPQPSPSGISFTPTVFVWDRMAAWSCAFGFTPGYATFTSARRAWLGHYGMVRAVVASRLLLDQFGYVAPAVRDAQDLERDGMRPVHDEVGIDRPETDVHARGEIVSTVAKERPFGEHLACCLDTASHTPGCFHVVGRDEFPYLTDVAAGIR